jgi:hypothetical protein
LHFLHSSKTQPFSFQAIPHSASKNCPGCVHRFATRIKMNQAISNGEALSRCQHCSIRRETSPRPPRPRFVSHPDSFLLNYIDPILYRVGPAGYLSPSAPRPRSLV